jgi:carbamoylphosphate synthase large subunit
MEHIEEAGIHSGDSACALPPVTLGRSDIESVRRATEAIAHGIGVVGLLNVQYALKDDVLYVLEANPRASRTVPFVSKATAVPLAKACARIMLGATSPSCETRAFCPRPVTAPPPPATRPSPSRRPCCRSTGSARPMAHRSTHYWARR